ncbi:MAG: LysM peptidoglycan-binding domain-containing protein, partial [Bacteroidota bacterium]|nr:LysM peptidoglycan-binding domain-containing protein [Bacteroidota bacterium]
DHSNFLRGSTRYSFLFKLDPRDYKGWAYGLRKAGYATNPRYPDILIKNIEDNNLEQYSLMAAGEVPVFDATKYRDDPADNNNDVPDSSTGQNSEPETVISSQPGRLTINGSKALLAKKGTSLLAIATQNNINLAKLLEMNDLDNDGLLNRDQIIFLEKKQKEGDRDYYISQQNETLYDVAQKNGVQLESICAFNKLSKENYIYPGTKILLRAEAQKFPVRATTMKKFPQIKKR